jgi:hypothetical protein
MNTRNRADIDGLAFDFCLGSAARIKAFGFAVIGITEYVRQIINTETAADALILIDPRLLSHVFCSFFGCADFVSTRLKGKRPGEELTNTIGHATGQS